MEVRFPLSRLASLLLVSHLLVLWPPNHVLGTVGLFLPPHLPSSSLHLPTGTIKASTA